MGVRASFNPPPGLLIRSDGNHAGPILSALFAERMGLSATFYANIASMR
jgi:hypothetical protein